MHIRTARAILQRLALCAGLCAGAWVAAEGLDHGTAHADDVPVRIEQEQPRERPGGLLDALLDGVAPGRGSDEDPPPSEGDNGRGDQDGDESPPAEEEEPADDNGRRGDDPPAEQPRENDEADEPDEDDTPARDVVEEILDEVLPDPPGPVDGDDGSPQHPVDTPPAPDPTPVVTPDPEPEQPAVPDTVQPVANPAQGSQPSPAGWSGPAPWTILTTADVQTGPRTGGSVCDSQGDRDGTGRSGRPGTSNRDRTDAPHRLPGPGLVPFGAPCDPDQPIVAPRPVSSTLPGPSVDQFLIGPAPVTRIWVLDYRRPAAMHDRHNDPLPPSRLTLWPPGPG